MSTITKERIANLLQFNSEGSDCQANAEQWEVHELARIALASLEAEAVADAVAWSSPNEERTCDVRLRRHNINPGPLYTAPPAPVSVPGDVTAEDCPAFIKYDLTEVDEAWARGFNACRAAMLQGADTELQRKAAIHDALCEKYNVESLADFVAWQRNHIAELEAAPPAPVGPGETAVMPDYPGYVMTQRECFQAGKKAGLAEAGNSLVIPDGWVMVPIEPTYHMCEAMGLSWESPRFPDRYKAMIAAAPHFREIVNSSTNNFRENTETSTNCPCCGRKPLKNKMCSVAGCDGKHVARGLCVKHYAIERKKDPSRRDSIRAADKRYRARKSAAPQQEVK